MSRQLDRARLLRTVDAVCAALAESGADAFAAYRALDEPDRAQVRARLDLPELRVLEDVPGARGAEAALALAQAREALDADLPTLALSHLDEGGHALAGTPDGRATRRIAEARLAEEQLATATALLARAEQALTLGARAEAQAALDRAPSAPSIEPRRAALAARLSAAEAVFDHLPEPQTALRLARDVGPDRDPLVAQVRRAVRADFRVRVLDGERVTRPVAAALGMQGVVRARLAGRWLLLGLPGDRVIAVRTPAPMTAPRLSVAATSATLADPAGTLRVDLDAGDVDGWWDPAATAGQPTALHGDWWWSPFAGCRADGATAAPPDGTAAVFDAPGLAWLVAADARDGLTRLRPDGTRPKDARLGVARGLVAVCADPVSDRLLVLVREARRPQRHGEAPTVRTRIGRATSGDSPPVWLGYLPLDADAELAMWTAREEGLVLARGMLGDVPALLALRIDERSAVELWRRPLPFGALVAGDAHARRAVLVVGHEDIELTSLAPTFPEVLPPPSIPVAADRGCEIADGRNARVDALLRTLPGDAAEDSGWLAAGLDRCRTRLDHVDLLEAAALGIAAEPPADLVERAGRDDHVTLLRAQSAAHRGAWAEVERRLETVDRRRLSIRAGAHAAHLSALARLFLGDRAAARRMLAEAPGCEVGGALTLLDALDPPRVGRKPGPAALAVAHVRMAIARLDAGGDPEPEFDGIDEVQLLARGAVRALDRGRWLERLLACSALVARRSTVGPELPPPNTWESERIDAIHAQAAEWLETETLAPLLTPRLLIAAEDDGVVVDFEVAILTGERVERVERDAHEEVRARFVASFGSEPPIRLAEEAALDFLADRLPLLTGQWEVLGEENLVRPKFRRMVAPRVRASVTGFELEFVFGDGHGRVPTDEVLEAWLKGRRWVVLDDGTVALLPERWLARNGPRLVARGVRAVVPDSPLGAQVEVAELMPIAAPAGLRTRLRPYQLAGLQWMAARRSAGVGACLADDMGLGKTVQAIALLLDTANQPRGFRRPFLIVAPTSLLANWASELHRFAPLLGRRTVVHQGAARAHEPYGGERVVVTSYELLRMDQDLFAATQWRLVIFDEAQRLKNPNGLTTCAARRLEADTRLALTGTPLENDLGELWSLFSVIEAGLLGRFAAFREATAEADAADAVRERIRPLVLRRRKNEVARDLPSRTEIVVRCQLLPAQRELYDALLRAAQTVARESGTGAAVLLAITRLRQCCCHPSLLGLPGAPTESAKLGLLMELLDEAERGGHRALVFSQWTTMLDLVEERIAARGWRWSRLDGDCPPREREGIVAEFSAPDGPPIMLLSLKAGGVGLNLVAADAVFLLDPWWNPAAETQAADRAHRIGQTRPVGVYRLVAEDTVEERVIALQERKRELFATVMDEARALLGEE